ncbi:hypothetical protein SNEBB_001518 [Seison nebaliae]|nr:hypothetical protein SNEBB_001518 [Seison nebaliae]
MFLILKFLILLFPLFSAKNLRQLPETTEYYDYTNFYDYTDDGNATTEITDITKIETTNDQQRTTTETVVTTPKTTELPPDLTSDGTTNSYTTEDMTNTDTTDENKKDNTEFNQDLSTTTVNSETNGDITTISPLTVIPVTKRPLTPEEMCLAMINQNNLSREMVNKLLAEAKGNRTTDQFDCSEYKKISIMHSRCAKQSPMLKSKGLSAKQKEQVLKKHNYYRSNVLPKASNMLKMYWDEGLAEIAQSYANTCNFAHDCNDCRKHPKFGGLRSMFTGQNIAYGYSTIEVAMEAWHNEVSSFIHGHGRTNPAAIVGHYTQMVAGESNLVGCGFADCANYPNLIVCNYYVGRLSDTLPYNSTRDSCSDCKGNCVRNLCDCKGKWCMNGGQLNRRTCKCECPYSVLTGEQCEKTNCKGINDSSYCQFIPTTYCQMYDNIRMECPHKCGIC